jgi:hypothetical protein
VSGSPAAWPGNTAQSQRHDFWLRGVFPFLGAAAVTEAFAQSAIDVSAPDDARPTSAQLVVGSTPQCTKRQFVDAGFVADGTCLRIST